MRARVTDGGSMEYAAARALFVAPRFVATRITPDAVLVNWLALPFTVDCRMPGEALTEKMQKRLGGLLPGSSTTPILHSISFIYFIIFSDDGLLCLFGFLYECSDFSLG